MNFLYENENIPADLVPHIHNNKALHAYFESSYGKVRPKNYCGFLSIDGESYFIVPKIVKEDDEARQTFSALNEYITE